MEPQHWLTPVIAALDLTLPADAAIATVGITVLAFRLRSLARSADAGSGTAHAAATVLGGGDDAGAGDEPGTVGAPGDGVDVVGVAAELGDLLARSDIDQADGVIAAAGGQTCAVGAERHAVDNAAQRDGFEQFVGLGVPEADGLV